MSLLHRIKSFLFDPGATPLPHWSHERLGLVEWSDEEEAWSGTHNGMPFLLAYERDPEKPTPEVVEYAMEILGVEFELIRRFECLRNESASGFPARFHDEIQALSLESIHLYRGTPDCSAIACLAGGRDGRHWRFDMLGTEMCNLSFDS